MEILRGDIFYIRKADTYGHEIESGRPAVIVSNDLCNKHSPVVEVVYLTSKEKKPMPTHVEIVCRVPSTALCEQIASVSTERLGDFIRCCTDDEMKQIDNALMVSLGISSDAAQIPKHEIAIDNTAVIERDLYKRLYEQLIEKITG